MNLYELLMGWCEWQLMESTSGECSITHIAADNEDRSETLAVVDDRNGSVLHMVRDADRTLAAMLLASAIYEARKRTQANEAAQNLLMN